MDELEFYQDVKSGLLYSPAEGGIWYDPRTREFYAVVLRRWTRNGTWDDAPATTTGTSTAPVSRALLAASRPVSPRPNSGARIRGPEIERTPGEVVPPPPPSDPNGPSYRFLQWVVKSQEFNGPDVNNSPPESRAQRNGTAGEWAARVGTPINARYRNLPAWVTLTGKLWIPVDGSGIKGETKFWVGQQLKVE